MKSWKVLFFILATACGGAKTKQTGAPGEKKSEEGGAHFSCLYPDTVGMCDEFSGSYYAGDSIKESLKSSCAGEVKDGSSCSASELAGKCIYYKGQQTEFVRFFYKSVYGDAATLETMKASCTQGSEWVE